MSKSISLTLQMNSPCDENWNGMEATNQGRFCNKCQKTVIDFTGFTDNQILQHFLKHPFPVCGRMLASQRDNKYENATAKINRNLSPVAATLLTLVAITSEASPPAPLRVNMQQDQPPLNKQVTAIPADSILISGTVKNSQGAPLENVEIVFEQLKTSSDKNGNFQFTLPPELNKTAVIQFTYPNLEKAVRSYNPLMGSARYEVVLTEPYFPDSIFMGAMVPAFQLPDPFSTLSFQSSNKLDSKTKAFLEDLAEFMKNDPRQTFTIRSYYNTSKQRAVKLSNLIKTFIVDEQGVDAERIHLADPQLRKENKSEVIIEFAQWEEGE
jgi:hypothetical protein